MAVNASKGQAAAALKDGAPSTETLEDYAKAARALKRAVKGTEFPVKHIQQASKTHNDALLLATALSIHFTGLWIMHGVQMSDRDELLSYKKIVTEQRAQAAAREAGDRQAITRASNAVGELAHDGHDRLSKQFGPILTAPMAEIRQRSIDAFARAVEECAKLERRVMELEEALE